MHTKASISIYLPAGSANSFALTFEKTNNAIYENIFKIAWAKNFGKNITKALNNCLKSRFPAMDNRKTPDCWKYSKIGLFSAFRALIDVLYLLTSKNKIFYIYLPLLNAHFRAVIGALNEWICKNSRHFDDISNITMQFLSKWK